MWFPEYLPIRYEPIIYRDAVGATYAA
jgi:hypothetical protein